MDYMFMPLKRYAEFSGRSRRKEYWMWMLFVVIVEAILYTFMISSMSVDPATGQVAGAFGLPFIILMLFALAIFIPNLAVTVRRLHDQDKSGWFFLLVFIPLVGPIILLVFMCLEGTRGPNQYGPDPKAIGTAQAV